MNRTRTDHRLQSIIAFADNIIQQGRDHFGPEPTPLFADGLERKTGRPAEWHYKGQSWIISNFANQQNLLRMLVGLTAVSGKPDYRNAATAATRHMFDQHTHSCGLLYWGGHQLIDLRTGKNHGLEVSCHEFKNTRPFYAWLWEVDPERTHRFIDAHWNAHILDWTTLDMNRHGEYGLQPGRIWAHDSSKPITPFFDGDGLTFINAGADLIYSALMLHRLGGGHPQALAWGKKMARLYADARHPVTGLGAYQYSRPRREVMPPADGPLPTSQRYGDRAENQWGPKLGDAAREGWALDGNRARIIHACVALALLDLVENLGDEAADLLQQTVDGMNAYFHHAYNPENNHFKAMWADGTDMTGWTIDRDGYYGSIGKVWPGAKADGDFLLAYSRAYRLSGDPQLWLAVRSIAKGLALGDPGEKPGQAGAVNPVTPEADYRTLLAIIEWCRLCPDEKDYLALAEQVADNLLSVHFCDGWFVRSKNHRYIHFDTAEPLALLALEAMRQGKPEAVPAYIGSRGYIHGIYDGLGRTDDIRALWSVETG